MTSANLNGRSLRWDTELGLNWSSQSDARALRQKLWLHHGGDEDLATTPMADALLSWKRRARENATVAPEDRKGFIAPYKLQPLREFGKKAFYIPDDMV